MDYSILQSDVSAIVAWIDSSLLSLQPAKCCQMLISRKKNSLPPPCILVGGTPLTVVSSVRYLGLQFHSDLSWSPHVANLCIKARKLIGLLYRRFGKHADSVTLLQLYKSFIRPHLEYCSIVWDPHLLGDIESLEKVQRFALRVCLKNWSCDRDHLYTQSGIPVLVERRSRARLCHLYKIINHLTSYPESPLEPRIIYYNNRSSHSLQFRNIFARTSQFQSSFFPGTIPLWNSLPHNTVSSPTLPTFISRLMS